MKHKLKVILLGAMVLVALLAPAALFADSIVFSSPGTTSGTGTVSYSAGGTFTVTSAVITDVYINGVDYPVVDGILDLTSGATSGYLGCTGGACLASFDAGGSLDVTGEVPGLGITTVSPLLSSSYLVNGVLSFTGGSNDTGWYSADLDPSSVVLNSGILAALLDTTVMSGSNTELLIHIDFTTSTYSGKVSESGADIITPEPATMSVLGLGLLSLLGLAGFRKRT
jgi:hypothetical protein